MKMRFPLPPWLVRMLDLPGSWRPGIAWQLGIAFIGVATLAAVANFAVQRTISITTTRVVPAEALSPSTAAAPRLLARRSNTATNLPALQRLEDAVEAARLAREPARLARVRAAAAELRASISMLHGTAAAARVDDVLRSALGTIDVAARRRMALDSHSATLAAVDARIQESLAKAWRILGRVVARQSLVTLESQLAELRRQAGILHREPLLPADISSFTALEDQVAAALAAAEKNLGRSLGADAYASTSMALLDARALRLQVVDLDAERTRQQVRYQADLGRLRSQLLQAPSLLTKSRTPWEHSAGPMIFAPARQATSGVSPWDFTPGVTTRQLAREEGLGRTGLAWLSAGVLGLLLAVSVVTMLSILRPVQRLIAASQRIAQGESNVRVPRAGSLELDRLGTAFNRMAADLEAAQFIALTYQQRLETRVSERTQQLQYMAEHDALTQLPNRRQLFSRLRSTIENRTGQASATGVFFLDLDNFKNINDGMGHAFGDRVLVAIAGRLRETIGSRGFAARFGGDEFTVVIDAAAPGTEALREIGRSLVQAFQRPLALDGREVLVSMSVGAAWHPEHAGTAESLLRAADAAMFRAKSLGRSQLVIFTPELLEKAASRFTTEQGLRQAVERGELQLVFQPEIDVVTLQVEAAEALLRWRAADGRMLPPDQFLSIAEESGLIIQISDWVMRSAIAAAARWRSQGVSGMRVAVNVSPRQLYDPGFSDRVAALLEEHGLPPELLEVELTESVLQTGAHVIDGLQRLQKLGVAVALDDFGTGYSSLASLEQLPLDRVKLDRSLIAGIDQGARSAALANATIRLCHDIGVRVTAEGVERCSQLAVLRDHGVVLQGFLLAHPSPEEELAGIVQRLPDKLQSLLLEAGSTPAASPTRATVIDIGESQRLRRPAHARADAGAWRGGGARRKP